MAADIPCHNHGIPWSGAGAGHPYTFHNLPDAGCRDEDTAALSLSGDLRISRHQPDACLTGCLCHCCRNLIQLVNPEPFFNHKGTGHVQRTGPHAGEVVDRAADAELSDVPAGEKLRRHDETVRCHCKAAADWRQHSRIVCREIFIAKVLFKDAVNQLRCLFPTGAVRHRDRICHTCSLHPKIRFFTDSAHTDTRRSRRLPTIPCRRRPGAPVCRPSRTPCTGAEEVHPSAPARTGRPGSHGLPSPEPGT